LKGGKMMNEKARKFRELAEKRVNNAIKQIQLIGNLSNKYNYEYTEEEVKKIINALKAEIRNLEIKFELSSNKRFKL